MTRKTSPQITIILLLSLGVFWLSACNNNPTSPTPPPLASDASATPSITATAINTSYTPSTPDPSLPLAAKINGQGITFEEYQAELSRAQAASSISLTTYSDAQVLQNLIDEVLLAQAAGEAGFIPDEALLQARIAQLGLDEQALQDWLTSNEYSQASFEQALSRSIAAAWMRDQIIASVPSTAEQVHARQILLYNSDEAKNVYAQLQAGSDFATLAAQYEPLALGDLGWFPKGYLTTPELDDPIFSLQPGEYTPVIETILGFHIVQVIERDPQHPLSPGALQTTKVQAIQNWLAERQSLSDIQISVP